MSIFSGDKPSRVVLDQVKQTAKTFQAFIDLAALVEGVDSIEQATTEAQGRLSDKLTEEKTQTAKLSDLATLVEAAKQKIDDAPKIVADITAQARKDAAKIVSDARDEATTIMSKASADAKDALARINNELTRITDLTNAKKDELGSITDDVAEKTAEYVKLSDDISAAKATIAKLLKA